MQFFVEIMYDRCSFNHSSTRPLAEQMSDQRRRRRGAQRFLKTELIASASRGKVLRFSNVTRLWTACVSVKVAI